MLEKAGAVRAELWARGSFLHSVRKRLMALGPEKTIPPRWNVWLATANEDPEDSTAQWLKRKLDMEHASSAEALSHPKAVWRRLVDSGAEESNKRMTVSPFVPIFSGSFFAPAEVAFLSGSTF